MSLTLRVACHMRPFVTGGRRPVVNGLLYRAIRAIRAIRATRLGHGDRRRATEACHGDVDGRGYQLVAVEASTSPTDSSQRSTSMAALQPSPAAVTAWRYLWSCTSPATNTPSTFDLVSPSSAVRQ